MVYTASEAVFSSNGVYRYSLYRRWAPGPVLVFILLNPSKAGADRDDPTVRWVVGYAKKRGFGGIHVVNAFAYIATDPKDLIGAVNRGVNPVGYPDNDRHVLEAAARANTIIAGWGNWGRHPALAPRVDELGYILKDYNVEALKFSKQGAPVHPLRQRHDLVPVRYWTAW